MTRQVERKVRSYVLRQGRLTSGQASALKNHWASYGIDYNQEGLDLDLEFKKRRPVSLDIGVGSGDTTLHMAKHHPENNYLAIEVHQPGVGSLIRRAQEAGLENIRVICHDVIEVLEYQLADNSLDQVCIFFPDPWPKKRHHKRRLVNERFLDLLIPKLRANARLHFASDWLDLAEHVLGVCEQHSGLSNLAGKGSYSPRPHWRPLTRFERRGAGLNHQVYDLCYALSHSKDRESN